MDWIKRNYKGLLLCLVIAIPAWYLGKAFPIIGGPVFAILAGMVITMFIKNKGPFESGIKFTSKKILQWAVVLLGFGLNLNVIMETGKQSLPIILCTITVSRHRVCAAQMAQDPRKDLDADRRRLVNLRRFRDRGDCACYRCG